MMWIVRGTMRHRLVEVHLDAPTRKEAIRRASARLIVVRDVLLKTDREAERARAIAAWAGIAAREPCAARCPCGAYFRNSIEQNRGTCTTCA